MKIIISLNGVAEEGNWQEPHGVISSVCHEPEPGVICQIRLGAAGVSMKRGGLEVGIPLAEIIKLFETAEPAFAEKTTTSTKSVIHKATKAWR